MRWRSAFLGEIRTTANLSARARAYLRALGISDPDSDEALTTLIWYHALAITYSPAWLAENGSAIRENFPRVPLPDKRDILERSAVIGHKLADLLDPDVEVPGVTTGTIRPQLRKLSVLQRSDDKPINPAVGDLRVEAHWGMVQRGSVVMPGPGKITKAVDPAAAEHPPLGARIHDVWLNESVFLHAVPSEVWDFTIGGYQVIKKWLSYREKSVLGRDLSLSEAKQLTAMIRRIVAVVLLTDELNDIYRVSRDHSVTWTS